MEPTASTPKNPVNKELIANDFHTAMYGKMEEAQIAAVKTALVATTTSYPATGSVASMVFYLQFQVQITNGEQFNGKAGGVSTPGGGALFGDVYTDNLTNLYNNTVSFEFNCTPVYTSLLFFDKNSNLLGSFQSGSVSTVLGIGGGSGSWK